MKYGLESSFTMKISGSNKHVQQPWLLRREQSRGLLNISCSFRELGIYPQIWLICPSGDYIAAQQAEEIYLAQQHPNLVWRPPPTE